MCERLPRAAATTPPPPVSPKRRPGELRMNSNTSFVLNVRRKTSRRLDGSGKKAYVGGPLDFQLCADVTWTLEQFSKAICDQQAWNVDDEVQFSYFDKFENKSEEEKGRVARAGRERRWRGDVLWQLLLGRQSWPPPSQVEGSGGGGRGGTSAGELPEGRESPPCRPVWRAARGGGPVILDSLMIHMEINNYE